MTGPPLRSRKPRGRRGAHPVPGVEGPGGPAAAPCDAERPDPGRRAP